MNPPIRDARHQSGLWRGVRQGVADVLGSDHAPHTREEKARPYPASPSGMPGVQTLVPVMLTHVAAGRLTLERFVDLTSAGPQRIFGIAGKGRMAVGWDADLTIVDLKAERMIDDALDRQPLRLDALRRHGGDAAGRSPPSCAADVVMREGELGAGARRAGPVRRGPAQDS